MTMYNVNKKSWRLLIGLLSITILVYLFQSSTFDINTIKSMSKGASDTTNTKLSSWDVTNNDSDRTKINITLEQQQKPSEKAFITFLCDDVMVGGTSKVQFRLLTNISNRVKQLRFWFIH